jgi:hypothetical protein
MYHSLQSLAGFDWWFPLTLESVFFDEHSSIRGLHSMINVRLDLFANIIMLGGGWPGRGRSLNSALQVWGFDGQSARGIAGAAYKFGCYRTHQLTWINLSQQVPCSSHPAEVQRIWDGHARAPRFVIPLYICPVASIETPVIDVGRNSKLRSNDEGTEARSERHEKRNETAASAEVGAVYKKARKDIEGEFSDREHELREEYAEKLRLEIEEMQAILDTKLRDEIKRSAEKVSNLMERVTQAQEVALSEHAQRVEVEEYLAATCESSLVVSEIIQRGQFGNALESENFAKLVRLQQKKIKLPPGVEGLKVGRTLYVAVPKGHRGRAGCSRTAQREARVLTFVAERLGVTPEGGLATFIRTNKESLVEAGKRVSLSCGNKPLSTEQTADLMYRIGASFTGMCTLSKFLRQTGHGDVLGRLSQVRSLVNSKIGKCFTQEFIKMAAGGKNEGKTCEGQTLTSCAWEAIAIDMDLAAANGTLLETSPLHHRTPGDEVIEFIFSYDKGGDVVRFNSRCLGVLNRCQSFKRVTTVGVYEPTHPLQKLKPAENYSNLRELLSRVRLFKAVNNAMVVCLGGAKKAVHVTIPKQCAWPSGSDPPFLQGSPDDLAELQLHRRGERHLSVVDEEAAVRSSEAGSAVFVLNGGLVEGIRVNLPLGAHLYFSLRECVPMAPEIRFRPVEVILGGDILSLFTISGMPGMSPFLHLQGDSDAATFKAATRDRAITLPLRTRDGQEAHLAKFRAQTGRVKHNENGVTEEDLMPAVPFDRRVQDPLHIFIGTGNNLTGDLLDDAEKTFDGVPEESILRRKSFEEEQGLIKGEHDEALDVGMDLLDGKEDGIGTAARAKEGEEDSHDALSGLPGAEYGPVAVALLKEVQSFRDEALKNREGRHRESSVPRSSRQKAHDEQTAETLEMRAMEFVEAAENISISATALKDIDAELEGLTSGTAGGTNNGRLRKIVKAILSGEGINDQRWWGGLLNGNDLRRYLKLARKILMLLRAALIALEEFSMETIEVFIDKHLKSMEMLCKIGELMRAARMLEDSEIEELCTLCETFGQLLRSRLKDSEALTPKTYCLELEIPKIARKFGTVGLLGQDGGEAAHPKWKNAANLSRCITNAKDRLRSTRRRFEGEQRCETFEWAKKTRVSRKQRESMAAAAAAEGDEE